MYFSLFAIASFASLAVSAPTASSFSESSTGFVSLDLEVKESVNDVAKLRATLLTKLDAVANDDKTVISDLVNRVTHYTVEIGIGEPSITYPLFIDTGSADFWVSNDTKLVDVPYNYDADKSKVVSTKPFHIDYVRGSADGFWAKNTFTFGKQIADMDYAIVYKGVDSPRLENSTGILGTGYPYKGVINLPERLKRDKIINKNAYSMSLVDFRGSNGNILFGGVDKSKYTGPLYTVPRVDAYPGSPIKHLAASLSSINLGGTTVNLSGIPALLDTGSTISYLPEEAYNQVAKFFGVSEATSALYGAPTFNITEYGNKEVIFDFSGAKIKVKGSDLAFSFKDLKHVDHGEMRIFGIWDNKYGGGYNILGDTFLRSAYVVYDLDGETISLAQANKRPGNPTPEPIIDAIPGAQKAPNSSK